MKIILNIDKKEINGDIEIRVDGLLMDDQLNPKPLARHSFNKITREELVVSNFEIVKYILNDQIKKVIYNLIEDNMPTPSSAMSAVSSYLYELL